MLIYCDPCLWHSRVGKGILTNKKGIKNTSNRPNIGSSRVEFKSVDFWCQKIRSSTKLSRNFIVTIFDGKTEIGQLNCATLDKNISQFYVPMQDSLLVEILDAADYLFHHFYSLPLRNTLNQVLQLCSQILNSVNLTFPLYLFMREMSVFPSQYSSDMQNFS